MKSMFALMPALALAGCSAIFAEQGSGKRATEERSVPPFTAVRLDGSAEVTIEIGKEQKVTIELDDNLLSSVKTEVVDNTLVIGAKKGFSTRVGLHVRIVAPKIEGVAVNGSGVVHVSGLQGEAFRVDISGSGDITASGAVDRVEADISGSGSADLTKLVAKDALGKVGGSGDIAFDATSTLKAEVSGSGTVRYKGSPKVESHVTGSGTVERSEG
jgi:hypothetical protein